MIREVSGNLLTADVDALVNTVNTAGVMGKGIALQFKRAYPAMFTAYEKAAKAGDPSMMMGIVLIVGIAVLLASIVADLAYSMADPRIRFDRGR